MMKLRTKGMLSFESVMWIFRMIFFTIVALIVVMFVDRVVNYDIQIYETESFVLVNRLLYSPNSLSFEYPEGIPHIGEIIPNRDDHLRDTINFSSQNFIASYWNHSTGQGYYNEKWYKRWDVLERSQIDEGAGTAIRTKDSRVVLVRGPNGVKGENATFQVLIPKS